MHVTSVTTKAAQEPEQEPEPLREPGEGGDDRGARPGSGGTRRKILVTLVVGLALIGVGVAVALSQAPPRVVRLGGPGVKAVNQNGVSVIGFTTGEPTVCQSGETLPAGVSAVRLSMWSFYGPPIHVAAYAGSRVLTTGSLGPGWIGDSVTVPVKALGSAATGVKLCFSTKPNTEPLMFLGGNTHHLQPATFEEPQASYAEGESKLLNGRVTVEYLASGHRDWFSRILAVARHAGLGRALSGTWIAVLIALLMLAVVSLALWLTLEEAP
jgi:hypothetical protein